MNFASNRLFRLSGSFIRRLGDICNGHSIVLINLQKWFIDTVENGVWHIIVWTSWWNFYRRCWLLLIPFRSGKNSVIIISLVAVIVKPFVAFVVASCYGKEGESSHTPVRFSFQQMYGWRESCHHVRNVQSVKHIEGDALSLVGNTTGEWEGSCLA